MQGYWAAAQGMRATHEGRQSPCAVSGHVWASGSRPKTEQGWSSLPVGQERDHKASEQVM